MLNESLLMARATYQIRGHLINYIIAASTTNKIIFLSIFIHFFYFRKKLQRQGYLFIQSNFFFTH